MFIVKRGFTYKYIMLLISLTPLYYSSCPILISVHLVVLYSCTDVIHFSISHCLSFPSFPPHSNSTGTVQCWKHVMYIHYNVYMIMLVFVYKFIFYIYVPHLRENLWPLPSEAGWFHLTNLQFHPFTWEWHNRILLYA
jgi:hypothetical protein